jgi:hypothetical protein
METKAQAIARINWNINDAHQALDCASSMSAWDNVIKYANQLKALENALSRVERNVILQPSEQA